MVRTVSKFLVFLLVVASFAMLGNGNVASGVIGLLVAAWALSNDNGPTQAT